ncbi:hypothetical protein MESS4_290020 [Mesorhizobium sp. STM 4661]|nr:hypothetical protein MESS4_290020 [Mesorhizobium sp. STM 4661]
MRAQLLPALPPGRPNGAADRYVDVPFRFPLHCTQNVTCRPNFEPAGASHVYRDRVVNRAVAGEPVSV